MLVNDLKNQSNSRTLLLGTVTLIAILDHTRMFFHYWNTNPSSIDQTTLALFLTRFVSHFFAPAALFVIGISAGLHTGNKSKSSNIYYYLRTGFLLLLTELLINNFLYTFDLHYRTIGLFFIGLLGICYLLMAIFQYLPKQLLFIICVAIIIGHNLLDPIKLDGTSLKSISWYILHQQKFLPHAGRIFIINYTLLPWFAVFAFGYLCSSLYEHDSNATGKRKPILFCGIALLALFLVLRITQLYGEPKPWDSYPSYAKIFISFINLTKYPASLCYLTITLGVTLVFLSLTANINNKLTKAISCFGSNFLFVYLFSTFLIHFSAMFFLWLNGGKLTDMVITEASYLPGNGLTNWGFSLFGVYIFWMMFSIALWYITAKKKHLKNPVNSLK